VALLALSTIGTLAPFALFAYGQSRVAPELAGAVLNLEPLVGAAAGALAFGDPFGPVQLLGGDALVLLSVALSATFVVAQPALLRGRDPIAVTAVQMVAGALAAAPNAILEGIPQAPAGAAPVVALIALVTAGTLVPFALFAYGQARVAAQLAGTFLNLEPLVGTAAGALAFGDPFGPLQLGGGAVILLGIVLSTAPPGAARRTRQAALRTRRRQAPPSDDRGHGGRLRPMNTGLHQIQLANAAQTERLRRKR
jgi:drug/metabolite transporter (DMT)-like permease